jgi:hypothetical protein
MPCKASNHLFLRKESGLYSIFIAVGFDRLILEVLFLQSIPQMQDTASGFARLDLSQT